jgi:UDP-N-acetylglucosamine diphosphorylase/glucosamine-1-phosphate N-acetyltransferase
MVGKNDPHGTAVAFHFAVTTGATTRLSIRPPLCGIIRKHFAAYALFEPFQDLIPDPDPRLMHVVLFEDHLVARLYPMTLGRAAFAITCGCYRLFDLVSQLELPIRCLVRPHLKAVVWEDFKGVASVCETLAGTIDGGDSKLLLVNARLVPSPAALAMLRGLVKDSREALVMCGSGVTAAVVSAERFAARDSISPQRVGEFLSGLPLPRQEGGEQLIDYPHDVVRHHQRIFVEALAHLVQCGQYRQQADGVFIRPGATLADHVVIDTSGGPVVLDDDASVGPFCYLRGPVRLGQKCRVIEHAAIKDFVNLGHTTKIGGEVEAAIVEPYTNKQHHGFLGHSYLGSWINLGAGTCNSDLKNTYGTVKMEYGREKVDTGMQFVGAVIGDYAKTAINTGIFTGKTIGVCSMVYGFVTTNVSSFTNYARLFGQVTESPVEVMVASQARMFARRKVTQRPCDIELIHAMYDLTRHERQLAGEPLSL